VRRRERSSGSRDTISDRITAAVAAGCKGQQWRMPGQHVCCLMRPQDDRPPLPLAAGTTQGRRQRTRPLPLTPFQPSRRPSILYTHLCCCAAHVAGPLRSTNSAPPPIAAHAITSYVYLSREVDQDAWARLAAPIQGHGSLRYVPLDRQC
jgi:hypothetical protein